MGTLIDLTGKSFGRLTVIGRSGKDKHDNIIWKCLCSCGNIIHTKGWYLRKGGTRSCGCLRLEEIKTRVTTHGDSKTRFYRIWTGIKARCYTKSATSYGVYGGKGIGVCERWQTYSNFKEDMYQSYLDHVGEYGERETTIDRIDVNGDYDPENCRWITYKEQMSNKSNNHIVEVDGVKMTIAQASEITGIGRSLITYRDNRGLDIYGNIKEKCTYEQ